MTTTMINNQAQLKALLASGAVADKDRNFATSIANAARPTAKQLYWVDKMIERYSAKAPALRLEDVSGIFDLFKAGGERLEKPRLKLKTGQTKDDGQVIRLKPYNGEIQIDDGNYPRVDFGTIDEAGNVFLTMEAEAFKADLIVLLIELANDPIETAARIGRLTGFCCFCSLQLTDERSLVKGYGPICAKSYQLPWGDVIAEDSALVPFFADKTRISHLKDDVKALSGVLDNETARNEQLEDGIAELGFKLAKAEERNARLVEENRLLAEALDALTDELAKLRANQ